MFKLFGKLKNKIGSAAYAGVPLKYGVQSMNSYFFNTTMAASVNLYPLSSYFVTFDASGNAGLTVATDTFISGAIIGIGAGNPTAGTAYYTTSSTAGGESLACTSDPSSVFRAPVISGTYSRTNRGKLCDCAVSAGVQGIAVQTSTRGHVRLLDGDETNNKWVVVQFNAAKLSGGNAS